MLRRALFIQLILFAPFVSLCTSQIPSFVDQSSSPDPLVPMIFQRQLQKDSRIRQFSVTVETRISILKPCPYLLVFRPKQYHYVDRVVLSRFEEFEKAARRDRPGNFLWNLDRAALASQIFLDGPRFTQGNYRLKFESIDIDMHPGCHVYRVDPIRQHHAGDGESHFRGRICVNPNDYTIVYFAGQFVPASQLHPPLVEFHNFEFESSWIERQQGLWLPDKVITNNSGPTRDAWYPDFEAETVFRDWTLL